MTLPGILNRLGRFHFRSFLLAFSLTACVANVDSVQDRAQGKAPYIFTQQHNAILMQQIRLGWPLQVQLPGNPAVWTVQLDENLFVEPRGRTLLYSPERIDYTQSLFIFDFALSAQAKAGDSGRIVITTDKLPSSLANVIPCGRYTIDFLITP